MPTYDFVRNTRREETVEVAPSRLVIFEGIMIFSNKEVRDRLDLKVFVDTPDDIRFIRRLTRDIKERGRTLDSVIEQYLTVVRPGHYAVHRADQAVRGHNHTRGRRQRAGPRRPRRLHQLDTLGTPIGSAYFGIADGPKNVDCGALRAYK